MLQGQTILYIDCPECKKRNQINIVQTSMAVTKLPSDGSLVWTGQCTHCFEVLYDIRL